MRSFLGLAGFYRRFVKDFSIFAAPLHELTKKGVVFHWEKAHEESFDTLKTSSHTHYCCNFQILVRLFNTSLDLSLSHDNLLEVPCDKDELVDDASVLKCFGTSHLC